MKEKIARVCVSESTSLGKVAEIMDKTGLKVVLVVDKKDRLLGILSFGDLRRAFLEGTTKVTSIKQIYNKLPVFAYKRYSPAKIKNLAKSKIDVFGGNIQVPIVSKDMKILDLAIVNNKNDLNFLSEIDLTKTRSVQRVLVTGGSGFLGSVLVRLLLKEGYQVKVLDNLKFGKESLSSIWAHRNFDLVVGDILNIEDLVEATKDVDAVVHLAAIVGDEASRENPTLSIGQNTIATIALASVCKKFQINRFVFTSTCSVYGANSGNKMLTEKSMLAPVSLYAQSKIDSEFELLKMTEGNFSPTILRLSTLCGWSYRPRFDLVVNLFSALGYFKKELKVFGGNQWRPFLSVQDAASAIVRVLESPLNKVSGEIFNVGSSSQNYTISQIAQIVKTKLKDVRIIEDEKLDDRRDYKVSFSKIEKVLGFKTSRTVDQDIDEIIKNLKQRKVGDIRKNAFNSQGLLKAFQ